MKILVNHRHVVLIAIISIIFITVYIFYFGSLGERLDNDVENNYSAKISDLTIINSVGERVDGIRTGDTIIFSAAINNIGKESKELFLIVKVRNETSHIIDSGINGSMFSPNEEKTLGIGWSAKSEGIYIAEVYVAEDFEGINRSSEINSINFEVR